MASEIAGVLLVPDDPALLADGPCGARPPVVIQHPHEGTWHDYGRGARDRRALVLAWDGKPVHEGLDRVLRTWLDHQNLTEVWMEHMETVADVVPMAKAVPRWLECTLVLVDADGREVPRGQA